MVIFEGLRNIGKNNDFLEDLQVILKKIGLHESFADIGRKELGD